MRENQVDFRAVAKHCDGSVLDAGCSFGMFSHHLAAQRLYVGVDWSRLAVEKARELNPTRLYLWGDVMHLGKGWHKAVDTVVALQLLEHYKKPRLAFTRLRKLARERIVLTVPRGLPKAGNTEGHVSGWEDEDSLVRTLSNESRIRVCPFDGDPAHICAMVWW